MKLEHLEYFSKIKQGLSLTALSSQMHISQQALSASIRVLENELGCKLLERTRKGIQFTKSGEELFFCTQEYLKKIREIKLKANPLSGEIFLPVLPYTISGYLDKVIRRFMAENPNVEFNFFYSSSMKRCVQFLLDGKAEIVLGANVRKGEKDLTDIQKYIAANDCQFVVCFEALNCVECHKDFMQYNNFFLKELSGYDCIAFAYNIDILNDLNELQIILDSCNCDSKIMYESNREIYRERLLTKKCYGLSIYDYDKENYKRYHDENLIQLLPKDKLNVQFGYVTKRDVEISPIVKRFMETMLQNGG